MNKKEILKATWNLLLLSLLILMSLLYYNQRPMKSSEHQESMGGHVRCVL